MKCSVKIFMFFVFICLGTSGCSHPQHVKARVWYLPPGENKFFPELDDPAAKIQRIADHQQNGESFGISFSGGGTRAASAALGQLRALKKIGLLDRADYISAISGGSWAVIPYLYFKPNSFSVQYPEEAFLGQYLAPTDIVAESKLRCKAEDEGNGYSCNKRRFSKAISNAKVGRPASEGWLRLQGDEAYGYVLGEIFLKPYELDCKDCFFTWSDETRNAVLAANEGLENKHKSLAKDGILTIRNSSGPFPIIGSTLMTNKSGDYNDHFPLEFTPLYSGSRHLTSYKRPIFAFNKDLEVVDAAYDVPVGGGYIESIAYDSVYPDKKLDQKDSFLLRRSMNAFSLRDIIASSGAAPQAALMNRFIYLLRPLTTNLGFPEFNYFHIGKNYDYGDHKSEESIEYSHGDGGHLDNQGLMPLLARKVQNILVFVNSQTAFSYPGETKQTINFNIDRSLSSFFDPNEVDPEIQEKVAHYDKVFHRYPHNVVFEGSEYKNLLQSFTQIKKMKNQPPLVHCQNYKIKPNPFWDITNTDKYSPNICWVYLDKNASWLAALQAQEIKEKIGKHDVVLNHYKHFPHYRTFEESIVENGLVDGVIDYTEPMVNLLADLTGWSVLEAAGTIKSAFKINYKEEASTAVAIGKK